MRGSSVGSPPAARRARSAQGAAASQRAGPGRGFAEAPRPERSGAARAQRAARPGGRWRCGGGGGRRARRRGPRLGGRRQLPGDDCRQRGDPRRPSGGPAVLASRLSPFPSPPSRGVRNGPHPPRAPHPAPPVGPAVGGRPAGLAPPVAPASRPHPDPWEEDEGDGPGAQQPEQQQPRPREGVSPFPLSRQDKMAAAAERG